MTGKKGKKSRSAGSSVSIFKALLTIILFAFIGLAFVYKEVKIDQSARETKVLQVKVDEVEFKIAEAVVKLNKLYTLDRISGPARELGLQQLKSKPVFITVLSSELPVEFARKFEPLKPKSEVRK